MVHNPTTKKRTTSANSKTTASVHGVLLSVLPYIDHAFMLLTQTGLSFALIT